MAKLSPVFLSRCSEVSSSIAAKGLFAAGLMRRGVQRLGTAKRVLESAGDRLAETEAIDVSEKHGTVDVGDAIGADLDAAVSLLELAGHPQVLGREAFALLKDSGSVESVALGARSSRGRRIVMTDRWSEAEALAKFATAKLDDVICSWPAP